ncbi:MAG: lipopolysaccharide biosynthesis protein RfbH [Deferribacteraceae bacterium]|jgi:CDP-6-deoxy-D-xylo-4-hexulose-3-dehydrase|nr:lipopolysaccharide biosynthesis protein RfbH [Deferribacteraceae bacterium]
MDKILRGIILKLVCRYYNASHKKQMEQRYKEGGRIGYAGRVFDSEELVTLVDSSLDFWLTSGKYTDKFERELAKFLGTKYVSFVNSGSSANLVAFMTLTSPKLGDRRINKGDEVITVAAGFPTTVSPMVQFGAIPVFVDIEIPTYNIDISKLEAAYSDKTKAVMVAHTLGNCFNLKAIKEFCVKHNLWLIEDNCDALGARYNIDGKWKYSGTVGDIGTSSFYPAHHITTGEGGAVYTDNAQLKQIADSFRDWGRDCHCNSGRDNACGRRFQQQFGEMPAGYDHKYIYSHFGYNLKASDMQAAVGCAQLKKLPKFIEARKNNWTKLKEGLQECSSHLILPEAEPDSDPSWFAFVITIKDGAGFDRDEIVNHLEGNGIQTRNVFAGNMIKQPCFDDMRGTRSGFRVVGDLTNTDKVMTDTFFIGVYPGLTNEMIDFMIKTVKGFIKSK